MSYKIGRMYDASYHDAFTKIKPFRKYKMEQISAQLISDSAASFYELHKVFHIYAESLGYQNAPSFVLQAGTSLMI